MPAGALSSTGSCTGARSRTFDCLWLDGKDLRPRPLLERKRALRTLIPAQPSRLLYVSHIEGSGIGLFNEVCRQDLEGIVAKVKHGSTGRSSNSTPGARPSTFPRAHQELGDIIAARFVTSGDGELVQTIVLRESCVISPKEKASIAAYQALRDLAVTEPALAARVASQSISDHRKKLIMALLPGDGYSLSQRKPVPFLKMLCARPDAVKWTSEAPAPVRPVWDHIFRYNRAGVPSVLVTHPYARPRLKELIELAEWCKEVGLDVQIDADSDHFPGVSLRVCFCREGGTLPNIGIA